MKLKSKKIIKVDPTPVYDVINANPCSNFLVKLSDDNYLVSHNCSLIDEVNFLPGSDPRMELSKAMTLYTTIKRRMESRYMKLGKIPGMLFLVSSKNSDMDFLEQYIKLQKDKEYLKLIDEPVWVIKADQGKYSGKYFKLAVGNRYLKSKILDDNEDPNEYIKNGQQVIDVPIEHKDAFELDINTSLTDIAGIAVTSNMKYIYYDKLKLAYRSYLENPFTKNEIVLGFDDDSKIEDYFLPEKLSRFNISKPHCIHWDPSITGDATGLAMSTIVGNKEVKKLHDDQVYTDNDILYRVEFAIRIKPEPGQEIPFYKIRNFIYHLRDDLNYNIIEVSCDTFQSRDSLQQLTLHGFNAKVVSVDRTRDPYNTLKNAINEERIIMPRIKELEDELLNLEDDKVRGKVDHPSDGSKDIADSVTASIYDLLNYSKLLDQANSGKDIESLLEAQSHYQSTHQSDLSNIIDLPYKVLK